MDLSIGGMNVIGFLNKIYLAKWILEMVKLFYFGLLKQVLRSC